MPVVDLVAQVGRREWEAGSRSLLCLRWFMRQYLAMHGRPLIYHLAVVSRNGVPVPSLLSLAGMIFRRGGRARLTAAAQGAWLCSGIAAVT